MLKEIQNCDYLNVNSHINYVFGFFINNIINI